MVKRFCIIPKSILATWAFTMTKLADLCRDSKSETRNSLEPGVANGQFQRPEEPMANVIGPLMDPRPLPEVTVFLP